MCSRGKRQEGEMSLGELSVGQYNDPSPNGECSPGRQTTLNLTTADLTHETKSIIVMIIIQRSISAEKINILASVFLILNRLDEKTLWDSNIKNLQKNMWKVIIVSCLEKTWLSVSLKCEQRWNGITSFCFFASSTVI